MLNKIYVKYSIYVKYLLCWILFIYVKYGETAGQKFKLINQIS